MKKAYGMIFTAILAASAAGVFGGSPPAASLDASGLKEGSGNRMTLEAGGKSFQIKLYENISAKAFQMLAPLEIEMHELNGNEKYYRLSSNLPTDPTVPKEIRAGELMLYGSDHLVLFYSNFASSYAYTRLGYVEDVAGLTSALGSGNIRVKLSSGKKH